MNAPNGVAWFSWRAATAAAALSSTFAAVPSKRPATGPTLVVRGVPRPDRSGQYGRTRPRTVARPRRWVGETSDGPNAFRGGPMPDGVILSAPIESIASPPLWLATVAVLLGLLGIDFAITRRPLDVPMPEA